MKCPKIYVVVQQLGDGYHLFHVELLKWFFDEDDAQKWIDEQDHPNLLSIEEVEGSDGTPHQV